MAADDYNTLKSCTDYPKMGTKLSHLHKLELTPFNGSLSFVVINLLGPLPQTRSTNQFLVTITDRYSELTRAISTTTITSTQEANIFFSHWAILYGITDTIFSAIK